MRGRHQSRPRTWDRLCSALELRQLVIEPHANIADLVADVLSPQSAPPVPSMVELDAFTCGGGILNALEAV